MNNLTTNETEAHMSIVFAGHVDHGKSTVIGRILADTGSLPQGKLEQVRENCERNARPFEYAFLIDALKDEQAQGITIDSARVFFKTARRKYLIIDAPGHIEFLKNMVTGASRAEAALLVIDAFEGIRENSRRHGYLLGLLGVKHIVILVNKMDLVGFSQQSFEALVQEYRAFLDEIGVKAEGFIPVSGREGDNITHPSQAMPWYSGGTVLDALDAFEKDKPLIAQPFRLPVQDVYKFTLFGDTRRIVSGRVSSGSIRVGEEIIFYPSGKRSTVKTIEGFNQPLQEEAACGQSTGLTLQEQIYIQRGEIGVRSNQPAPRVSSQLRVKLFWLGKKPMLLQKEYTFKLGTVRARARIESIQRVIDATDLTVNTTKTRIERLDVAECTLKLNKAIAFDLGADLAETCRFVIVDDYDVCGGGLVIEDVPDTQSQVRDSVILRNMKWERSNISPEERAERYNQRAMLVLITGEKQTGKKRIAKQLETRLFNDGKFVYYLGIGSVVYGVDADIRGQKDFEGHHEHIRRLAEIAHMMLDSGVILIVTAVELTQADLEIFRTAVGIEKIQTIWVGERITTDINFDLQMPELVGTEQEALHIKRFLQDLGVIFSP